LYVVVDTCMGIIEGKFRYQTGEKEEGRVEMEGYF
jgi:hypothetical protein